MLDFLSEDYEKKTRLLRFSQNFLKIKKLTNKLSGVPMRLIILLSLFTFSAYSQTINLLGKELFFRQLGQELVLSNQNYREFRSYYSNDSLIAGLDGQEVIYTHYNPNKIKLIYNWDSESLDITIPLKKRGNHQLNFPITFEERLYDEAWKNSEWTKDYHHRYIKQISKIEPFKLRNWIEAVNFNLKGNYLIASYSLDKNYIARMDEAIPSNREFFVVKKIKTLPHLDEHHSFTAFAFERALYDNGLNYSGDSNYIIELQLQALEKQQVRFLFIPIGWTSYKTSGSMKILQGNTSLMHLDYSSSDKAFLSHKAMEKSLEQFCLDALDHFIEAVPYAIAKTNFTVSSAD